MRREWIEHAQRDLRALAAAHKLTAPHVTTAVASGSPAIEILRDASEQHASVIVLGSHDHGLVQRFLLGHVAERVTRHAGCPVMVVPHRTLRMTSFEVKAASGVES